MLFFRTFRAVVGSDPHDQFRLLREDIALSFRPLLAPAFAVTASVLKVSPQSLRDVQKITYGVEPRATAIDGEIFTDGTNLVWIDLSDDLRRRVARIVAEQTDTSAQREQLRFSVGSIGQVFEPDILTTVIDKAQRAFSVALEPFTFKNNRFDELKTEGRTSAATPSTDELQPAQLLSSRSVRMLAIAIKSSGGLLVKDLQKQLPTETQERIDEITAALRTAGLIESEIVAVCTKSQVQIARAPSKELLVELSDKGVKCACGRPLASERIEEALSITEAGRMLIDKARWLTVLLFFELQTAGIPSDSIVIEQTLGGDEIDCLAKIGGELALFELKDKEFNLGNAYSFGAKIGIIRPTHPIIVTTERVGNDAREHFARSQGARSRSRFLRYDPDEAGNPITFIEGVEHLRSEIQKLVSSINRSDAARLLDPVLSIATVGGPALIRAIEQGRGCHLGEDEAEASGPEGSIAEMVLTPSLESV